MRRRAATVGLLIALSAGCGVSTEDEPRIITDTPVPETASTPEVTSRPHSPPGRPSSPAPRPATAPSGAGG